MRLISSFPPGGSSDAVARIIQPGVEKRIGQPLVIENRPGAGGMLAIDAVAKAAPDGYTIGLGGAGALGTNMVLQEKMPYDPRNDIVLIAGLAASPFILAASPSNPDRTLKDVLARARDPEARLAIGHGGNGTAMHLTAELINQMAGTKIDLVPYRGIAPVVNDLIGNHIALGIVDPPSSMVALEAGRIWPVVISSTSRFPRLPDIPTFAESGLPGFESTGWFGIVTAKGVPPGMVEKLSAAITATLRDADVAARIRALGTEPMPMTVAEFEKFARADLDKWIAIAARAGKKGR